MPGINEAARKHVEATINQMVTQGYHHPLKTFEQVFTVEYMFAKKIEAVHGVHHTLYGLPALVVMPVMELGYSRVNPTVKEEISVYVACMPHTPEDAKERFGDAETLRAYLMHVPKTWGEFIDRTYDEIK